MFKTGSFDKLLEKATSSFLLDPDWEVTLQIGDSIRQGDVQPKYAVTAIKKKISHQNPHVAMLGLQVLESCVKNCGSIVHDEVATKPFMEEIKGLAKTLPHENVKAKLIELIQTWAHAFRNTPKYRAVQDTLNIMKAEGYKFPVLQESDAMFVADTAPTWADGECCHRCRVLFGMMQRKHHCRACGQVFCAKCSSKTTTLPKLGFEKEVRVCDPCYESANKPSVNQPSVKNESDLPPEYLASSLSQQSQLPPKKTEEELREEEELNLALALSKSEAEEKEKEKLRATTALLSNTRIRSHSPPPTEMKPHFADREDENPELARYLNRGFWEQKQKEDKHKRSSPPPTQPSAPVGLQNNGILKNSVPDQNGEADDLDDFVSTLRTQIEIFVNRMKSNSSRGRSIANDSSVQTLFMNITALHSQLLKNIAMQDERRNYYEVLQDKLAQARDARAALDALREEHQERLRRQAEEIERQRQLQMAHKLEIMRKKKQEYLQYQRQVALQRMQEQEREIQMHQEQKKQQQYLQGPMAMGAAYGVPYVAQPRPPMQQPSFNPDGSPMHVPYHHPPTTSGPPGQVPQVPSGPVPGGPVQPHMPGPMMGGPMPPISSGANPFMPHHGGPVPVAPSHGFPEFRPPFTMTGPSGIPPPNSMENQNSFAQIPMLQQQTQANMVPHPSMSMAAPMPMQQQQPVPVKEEAATAELISFD